MSPFARRAATVAVTLLTLAMVAVLVLRAAGAPIALGPSPAASSSPSGAASATPDPTSEPTADGSSAPPPAEFADIEEEVLAIRGLSAPDIGPAELITRAQLADELEEILDASWTDEELERANLTLLAMGLLDEGQDLRQLNQQLLAGQVLGFYDPPEQRMVVVSDSGVTPLARITYAHEYTHALQDAAFDTFAAREDLTDDDAILARLALEEGDATVVMFDWALANMDPGDMIGIGSTPLPDLTGIPDWMVRQLEFPYLSGYTFVSALRADGGWEAVNAAYDQPPVSTEQVIHLDRYLAGEEPIEVDPLEPAGAYGTGWQDLDANTIGEAMIQIWLRDLGVGDEASERAASDWGGDSLAVASGPDGAWVMAWRIVWDDAFAAEEFAGAYQGIEPPAGMATQLVRASDVETVVVHASSPDLLDEAATLAGG